MQKVNVDRTLIFGCLHTPFQHVPSHLAMLDFIKYWKPNSIIINGDNHDLSEASKYFKDPSRKTRLQDEVDAAVDSNVLLRQAAGKNCDIILNIGNHEARWPKYLAENAPTLLSLRDITLEKLFGLEACKIDVNWGKNKNYARLWLGEIQVGHFPIIRAKSAATESALVEAKGVSIITSHHHRMGTYFKTLADGRVLSGNGTGCLCDQEKAENTEDPNWQHGFIIVEKFVDKNRYHVTPMPIVGGNILFDGRLF